MIERMQYLNITGPKTDLDRMLNVYLSRYEIHLENALTELGKVREVHPFLEANPYREALMKAEEILSQLPEQSYEGTREMSDEEAILVIDKAMGTIQKLAEERDELKAQKKEISQKLVQLEPYRMMEYDLRKIQDFKFIKFRFGKMPLEYYKEFTLYAYDNAEAIFYECGRDTDYVWGAYFVPAAAAERVNAVFSILHFEEEVLPIPEDCTGTPEEVYQTTLAELQRVWNKIRRLKKKLTELLEGQKEDVLCACYSLKKHSENFDIRKMAACANDENSNQVFYILCGWMTEQDAKAFLQEAEKDDNVYCIAKDSKDSGIGKPPTKLKNPRIFKPFEMFIEMYGLPSYNEIDPTIFIGITYSLMFGIMFGDVGQGLLLALGGLWFYKSKGMRLGGIVALAGSISTIFGFLYGSVFGLEEVMPALWRRPMSGIMDTLILAVVFGVVLIIIAMLLHIYNAAKNKDFEKTVLDASGLAGLIAYGSIVASLGLMATGHALPGTAILVVVIGLPLLAIFLKEPLNNLVQKNRKLFPAGSKAMFFVEAFVELFDVVLSYATNTISFVRVGAFALSHAGMMGVVMSLAGLESGHPNIIIIVLGNLLVAALEGLVVGIQVLRLEYYEMFSRFYSGTGRPFQPYKVNQ